MNADDLWGATLNDVRLDPVAHVVRLSMTTVDNGDKRDHEVVMTGVSALEFFTAIPEPWEYAEVTELRVEPDGKGQFSLRMMLWTEEASLRVRCREVQRRSSFE